MNLKEIDWKKYFTKKHCIIYAAIVFAVVSAVVLIVLLGGNGEEIPAPEETTPAITTPAETTPAETNPSETTPSYPAEGETDPKQEDVFDD